MSDRTPIRTSESDHTTESHERTNERTEKFGPDALTSHVGRHAGAYDDLTTVGEVMANWPQPGRHPIVRTGERDLIPPHVRAAVWYRDRGKCELCGSRVVGAWHLDHITPWSAGGSDDTTNLRVLCEAHNMGRGNAIDPTERPRRAATWWCQRCYSRQGFAWEYVQGIPIACQTHGPLAMTRTGRCRALNGYIRAHQLTGKWPDWHEREPLIEFHTIAYCAHCNAPGLTGVTL